MVSPETIRSTRRTISGSSGLGICTFAPTATPLLALSSLISDLHNHTGMCLCLVVSVWNRGGFYTAQATPDALAVEVSNGNSNTWTLVESVGSTGGAWEPASFVVSEHVPPTAEVRVRFTACDCPNNSITEAGIDDFLVERFTCGPCPTDLNGDGVTNVLDLIDLLLCFGQPGNPPCDAPDITTDGPVTRARRSYSPDCWPRCAPGSSSWRCRREFPCSG